MSYRPLAYISLWLSALAITACGSSDPEPIQLEQYCARLTDAFCDGLVHNCACGTVTEQGCRAAISSACMTDDPTLAANINDGIVRYDGVAAARLIEKLNSATPDCEAGIVAGWRAADFFTSAGVWTGTKIGGATCLFPSFPGLPNDCASGACSISRRVCIAGVGDGENCDTTHECYDLDAPFPAYERCAQASLGATNICMPFLELGEACVSSPECASGLCESGSCAFFISTAPFGGACTADSQCQSGFCDGATCGHAVCGDFAVHQTP
ncbi:MAG: hypothetical protein IPK60_17780 [Sandaracinaceae bacterium]|nr:hypothetical protein [Sandaracinaceae bacterium]